MTDPVTMCPVYVTFVITSFYHCHKTSINYDTSDKLITSSPLTVICGWGAIEIEIAVVDGMIMWKPLEIPVTVVFLVNRSESILKHIL